MTVGVVLLLGAAACHPHVERRSPTPTTDFCKPITYLYDPGHDQPVADDRSSQPRFEIAEDGLRVDDVVVAPRRSDWRIGTGSRAPVEGHRLRDGRWLISVDGEDMPAVGYAAVAYLWEPGETFATYVGRILEYPYDLP